MGFGDVLRELLESKNITQKQLAEDLNIGVTTIGNDAKIFHRTSKPASAK